MIRKVRECIELESKQRATRVKEKGKKPKSSIYSILFYIRTSS